jgi:hypothetical protein
MGAGEATDALDHWVHRIEHLVQPQPPSPEDQHSDDINPFSGLVSLLKMLYQWFAGKSVRQAPADAAHLDPDTPLESVGRSIAILQAMQRGHDLYNHLRRQTE